LERKEKIGRNGKRQMVEGRSKEMRKKRKRKIVK
jgi:hypothetical protein